MSVTIASPLTLPCGITLKNRIAKAAMSEQIAEANGAPSETLIRLYANWAHGGVGMLMTGNVMIDHNALVEPRNAVLEDDKHLDLVARWARAGNAHGAAMIMQINHPGRVPVLPLLRQPVGPSAIRPGQLGYNLRKPRALSKTEVKDMIARYARTAQLAVEAGFNGVQVHAAHGYLLSQFLSPKANHRDDEYGGDPKRRMAMLLEVVEAVRAAIGHDKVLSVKLNSSDFENGGLTAEESLDVALALEAAGIDLLEISGGNYEAPAMTGVVKSSTASREAYFLSYAEQLRELSKIPLMLTGGVRTAEFMNEVLGAGAVDVIGLGRPMALHADYPARLLAGTTQEELPRAPRAGFGPVDAWMQLAWHAANFERIANGSPKPLTPGLIRGLAKATATMSRKALTQ
ncbi:NADH:flavin oxidoreductase/NADH oxidase family protein [Hoyosella altamirensis]|uniref:2,4-dienoyl-CoA reductase-like NADH-dependent reductase (Old Yellow Enzyme family) n=1 Tax=Hoyosella altamirensis TaxID=616997 RepID=A0A839RLC6_9ACTN|nr:NADH:flavin oxidoreductase/NADH oxidase family protein [Hoyosella altamirensis]MBB3037089.1 2,4-dienoyl-CoA reductase-like NADH-dependent reductase (Old Yellow Enzyme family) [Hoyosella altamirensis]